MNSARIDTFLKATQASPKAQPPASSDGGSEFNEYLREAATTQQKPTTDKPAAKTKASDAPIQTAGREQDSAKSSDKQANPIAESADQGDEALEEQSADEAADEVLLSVAAITASAAEVTPVADVAEINLEVAAPAAIEQTQPAHEAAPSQDFLPELNQALADDANASSETAAATEVAVPVDATSVEEAAQPIAPQAVAEEAAASAAETLVTIGQSEQAPATNVQSAVPAPTTEAANAQQKKIFTEMAAKSDGDAEKSSSDEHKAAKPAAADKVVDKYVAEQIVGAVSTTIADRDRAHDAKYQQGSDSGAPAPDIQGDSQPQQQFQAKDAARADAQGLQGDTESRMPTVDRTRFVQRVANAFRSAQQNDGHIQMRLSPPELGSLRIEIAVRHGVLTANLETETADARRVLLDNLPALRQRLAEQDIRIEKFDVDVRREGSQSDGQSGAQDRQAQQQSERAAAQNRIRTTTTPEIITARVPRSISTIADANLDVRI